MFSYRKAGMERAMKVQGLREGQQIDEYRCSRAERVIG